jgi:uncharacterized membrane protein
LRQDGVVWLTRGAIIAALYVALTLTPPLNAISFGPIQFRISEALTALAFFEPAAIPGLYIGVMLANLGSPFGAIDIFGGSLLTLIAAYLTWKIRNPLLALLPPVIINALGVAAIIKIAAPDIPDSYLFIAFTVGLGEAVVVYGLGYPLLQALLKRKVLVREDIFRQKMGK